MHIKGISHGWNSGVKWLIFIAIVLFGTGAASMAAETTPAQNVGCTAVNGSESQSERYWSDAGKFSACCCRPGDGNRLSGGLLHLMLAGLNSEQAENTVQTMIDDHCIKWTMHRSQGKYGLMTDSPFIASDHNFAEKHRTMFNLQRVPVFRGLLYAKLNIIVANRGIYPQQP